jgi:hypothetical protein
MNRRSLWGSSLITVAPSELRAVLGTRGGLRRESGDESPHSKLNFSVDGRSLSEEMQPAC